MCQNYVSAHRTLIWYAGSLDVTPEKKISQETNPFSQSLAVPQKNRNKVSQNCAA